MRPTTAVAGAAALLLAAGLAACSSDPEPGSPLPTGEPVPSATGSAEPTAGTGAAPTTPGAPSTSPSPSSEQSVAAPTLPPEATTNDAAGAEAFVRYWYEALNFAIASGDTNPVLAASSPECEVCGDLIASVDDSYADGGRLEGGEAVVVEAVAPTPDNTGAILLSVVVEQEGVRGFDSAGKLLFDEPPPDTSSQSVVLQRLEDGSGWWMYGLGL